MEVSKITVILALTALSLAAPNSLGTLNTEISVRQTTITECNSYAMLTERISDAMVDTISDIASRLYKPKRVLKAALVRVVEESCQVLATKAKQIKKDIRSECANNEINMAAMHVFGGLCTDKGGFTPLADDLLAGYKYVVSACIPSMHPILHGCPIEEIPEDIGVAEGHSEYRRIMLKHLKCVFTGIDDSDGMPLCGDTPSLKRMAVLFELLTYPGPGVAFTMANFGL
ncbi:uncharacterized protein LOC110446322 [Mizuhopecten yessoensis]|uniref:Uncharacterized protein n=1 Tax=Mizuhopecten yessoensis TaxID=6573 RepID=A0A210QXT6_MIZYE|nr:uncharacterized protein LOC110446322 [Mizuhopecten yessoensis]OWF53557.1 hypothetical protein KP79_PYT13670 [Mizuhopecten yessoensis]